MTGLSTLAMLLVTGVVVGACLAVVIRFDVAARADRARFERRIRRSAAELIREADAARRERP